LVKAGKKIIQEFKQSGGKYIVVTSSCAEYSWESPEPLGIINIVTGRGTEIRSIITLIAAQMDRKDLVTYWATA